MGKTPDEIKKGLECCNGDDEDIRCDGCPYAGEYDCVSNVTGDALALIRQQEWQNSEMWSNTLSMQDALTKQERVRSNLQERISQLEAQVPRWISVKERLPEVDTGVLVAVRHMQTCQFYVRYDWRIKTTERCWWWKKTSESNVADLLDVTHWMPLPKPPEET